MFENPGVTQRGKMGSYLTMNVANSKKKNQKLLVIVFLAHTVILSYILLVRIEIDQKLHQM